jgi:hypothetical protein
MSKDVNKKIEQIRKKAKAAGFNSFRRVEDHFVDITEMVTFL